MGLRSTAETRRGWVDKVHQRLKTVAPKSGVRMVPLAGLTGIRTTAALEQAMMRFENHVLTRDQIKAMQLGISEHTGGRWESHDVYPNRSIRRDVEGATHHLVLATIRGEPGRNIARKYVVLFEESA